jgi:DNA topoisomerase-1
MYFDNITDDIIDDMLSGGKNNVKKWNTLKHNGIIFQEPYIKHNIPLIYNNEKIILPPLSEEYATIYSKLMDTEYIKNPKLKKNFFHDWKALLKKENVLNITNFDLCDFSLIYKFLLDKKIEKQNYSLEEKNKLKEQKLKEEEKYKYATVDNELQEIGNYRLEPTGIMIGHGCNPKIGKIKLRIYPEDITVNIGKNENIPELPDFYKNHKWGNIIHDQYKEWLYSWHDNLTNKTKYILLNRKSKFKARSDEDKFDMARELKKNIEHIRATNFVNMQNSDLKKKQLSLALYLIDRCALRVGNEKNSKNETETFGVCSLKIYHVDLSKNNIITLDFLGKDSVRYKNSVHLDNLVYNEFVNIYKDKGKNDDLFDLITPIDLNLYLKQFLPNLTAKTFRTFNASNIFQEEIKELNLKYKNININDQLQLNKLLNDYIKANLKVAQLCNHQKNISKSLNSQIDKINDKIKILQEKKNDEKDKKKISKLNIKIKEEKNKRNLKIDLSNISLTTSKMNYIDPRITIAFIKLHNLPDNISEKLMSSKNREIFWWALDVDKKWIF